MKTGIVLLEDEELTAKRTRQLVVECDPTATIVATIPSVSGAVEWLSKNHAPDLFLMDVHLEDDLVFELFERIEIKTPVIFITAYDEYVVKAFKVNSIDYLLKPVERDHLDAALKKFRSVGEYYSQTGVQSLRSYIAESNNVRERFMVTVGKKLITVPVDQIAFFSLEYRTVFLTTIDGQHLPINYSLDALVHMLDTKSFFRVNRQFIVSMFAVKSAMQYSPGKIRIELSPSPKEEVSVSGDRMSDFKDWFGR
jgi:two-component system, LytTR family, response regulator